MIVCFRYLRMGVLLLVLVCLANVAVCISEDPYLVVSERTKISRVSLDGQTKRTIVANLRQVYAIAIDYKEGLLFYADIRTDSISRVYLDGSNQTTILRDLPQPKGLAVDHESRRIYWTDEENSKIESASYDGKERKVLVSGLVNPTGIALDLADRRMYWTDWGSKTIGRANLDGKNPRILFSTNGGPMSMTIDTTGRILYWSDTYAKGIYSYDIDFANGTKVPEFLTEVKRLGGLTVQGEHLYYSQEYAGSVSRVNKMNGSNVVNVVKNLSYPSGIQAVQPQLYVVSGQPILKTRREENGALKFLCKLPEVQNGTEFEVKWRSGDRDVVTSVVSESLAVLDIPNAEGVKLGLTTTLMCVVRTRQVIFGKVTLGREINSDIFKAEFKLVTKSLKVAEGKGHVEVVAEMNAPPMFFGAEKVNLSLALLPEQTELRTGKQMIEQVVLIGTERNGVVTSNILVDETNWFERHVFKVVAKLDMKVDGLQKRKLQLRMIVRDGPEVLEVLDSRRVKRSEPRYDRSDTALLNIEDGDTYATCQAITDPHMKTLDGREYDIYFTGEFVFYKQSRTLVPRQINLMLYKCGSSATCTCGVAVQEGDNVLIFDRCRRARDRSTAETNPSQLRIYVIGRKSDFRLKRSDKGKTHEVTMSHGGKLKVCDSSWMNFRVYYTPSTYDDENTEGLCGFYDRKPENDLTLRNGGLQTEPFSNNQPNAFSRSWKVPRDGNSLFVGVPPTISTSEEKVIYCSVVDGKEECNSLLNTVFSEDSVDVAKELEIYRKKRSTLSRPKRNSVRRKRAVEMSNSDFDPFAPFDIDFSHDPTTIKMFPTPKGLTERYVRDYCNKTINGHRGVQQCARVSNRTFHVEVEGCFQDIGNTDDLTWANNTVKSVLESCSIFLDTLDNSAADNEPPPPLPNGVNRTELLNAICPDDCNGQGVCTEGTCVCDTGYIGYDCSMHLDDPPEVTVLLDTFCDVNMRSCAEAVVYGDKFHDRESLTCHLMAYTLGDPIPTSHTAANSVPARFSKFDEVRCPIPVGRPYLLQVSNDGVHPAPEKRLFYGHDSRCFECGMSGEDIRTARCERTPYTCVIEDKCYVDSERNPQNLCEFCDAVRSESAWTPFTGDNRCVGHGDITLVASLSTIGMILIVAIFVGGFAYSRHRDSRRRQGASHGVFYKPAVKL